MITAAGLLGSGGAAFAVPDFASQTGEPCTRCHIGAFGPQLTPFGRAFKIGGYTQGGGDGLAAKIPLSVMLQSSFTNTQRGLPAGTQPHHYDTNNNFSLDQISVFVAGRVSDHTGGFMQFTWSDVSNQVNVDDVDLRPYTTLLTVGEDTDLRVGTTINNAPTAQDPYNSTPFWGFPYISSLIAPAPSATPVLAGRFAGNTIGYTVYGWYDRQLYLEAGAYTTPSAWLLTRFGNPLDPGAIIGGAPYVRAAYEWQWNDQAAHIGALYFSANVNPGVPNADGVAFGSTGQFGQDRYTDYAFDGGYQFLGDGSHIVTAQGIYIHEDQTLNASAAGGPGGTGTTFHLEQINANVAYWYQNTYGVTLGWTKTWGSRNVLQVGSANGKPNSNAFTVEADWVPFGKQTSAYAPFANLKLGVQYTAYTQFDGGTSNFDGAGRSAGDNNTLLVFAWFIF